MKRMSTALAAAAVLGAAFALAVPPEAPKPGPDTRKLEVFAGKWKGESNIKPGPWGAGGKMTSEEECTWFQGGFQLVCRGQADGPMGKVKSEAVLGWSAEEKIYKYQGFDSTGMMGSANGTLSGNTWSWSDEAMMGGKMIKSHYTVVVTPPNAQSFKWETSEDGKTWTTMAEGKSTKK